MGRIEWVDQVKGIGILLMIYAHNFPIIEDYIYTFHMPLFFFIAGMFHPKTFNKGAILRRAKTILIPYFFWSICLFLFWWLIGRYYGESATQNYCVWKNFIGVFYAQGDAQYMNWGIPMWFLPCLFMTFILFGIINKITINTVKFGILILAITFGFLYPSWTMFKLPWSIDVALVALIFYASAFFLKKTILRLNRDQNRALLLIILVLHGVFIVLFMDKVDMYRSTYGNPLGFIVNALTGTLMVMQFARVLNLPRALAFIGKNTLILLALHGRALTVIKLVMVVLGIGIISFSEIEKVLFSCIQVLLILPIIFLVNKYVPILNGKVEK